jgi:hypothetical protein
MGLIPGQWQADRIIGKDNISQVVALVKLPSSNAEPFVQ